MAYYTCRKCFFTFERVGPVTACPDCAHMNVREATAGEISEFHDNRAESGGAGDSLEAAPPKPRAPAR